MQVHFKYDNRKSVQNCFIKPIQGKTPPYKIATNRRKIEKPLIKYIYILNLLAQLQYKYNN